MRRKFESNSQILSLFKVNPKCMNKSIEKCKSKQSKEKYIRMTLMTAFFNVVLN